MSAVKPPPSLPRGMYWRRGQISVRVSAYGKRHHLGDFDTLTDAKAALQIAKGEIARGTFKPPAQEKAEIKAAREAAERAKADRAFTVAQWAEQWLANAKRANGTPWTVGTTESYRSHLRAHILPQIGDRPLVEVTREDIDVMLFRVKSAGGSPRHVGTTVRAMFKAAELNRIGGLEHSPVQITTPKAKTAATLADRRRRRPDRRSSQLGPRLNQRQLPARQQRQNRHPARPGHRRPNWQRRCDLELARPHRIEDVATRCSSTARADRFAAKPVSLAVRGATALCTRHRPRSLSGVYVHIGPRRPKTGNDSCYL